MTLWTQIGVGVYIVGAVAFSLHVVSVDGFPKVTWTGPPPSPKQERRIRIGIAVGMYSMLIIASFFWPILLAVKAYNRFTRDDEKNED